MQGFTLFDRFGHPLPSSSGFIPDEGLIGFSSNAYQPSLDPELAISTLAERNAMVNAPWERPEFVIPNEMGRSLEAGREQARILKQKIGQKFSSGVSTAAGLGSTATSLGSDYLRDMGFGVKYRLDQASDLNRQLAEAGFYDPSRSELLNAAKTGKQYVAEGLSGIGQRFSGKPRANHTETAIVKWEPPAKKGGDWSGILGGIGMDAIGEAIFAPMQYNARIQEGQSEGQAMAGTLGSSGGSLLGSTLGGFAGRGIARKFFGGKGAAALEIGGAIGASILGEGLGRTAIDAMTGADKVAMQRQMEMMQQMSGQNGMGIAQPITPAIYGGMW